MKLSMRFLSDFVSIDMPIREFCEGLTMSGSKVERSFCEADGISGVVVGKVLECRAHADADKLKVLKVAVGAEKVLQIVTGAQNVKVGDYVPTAVDGAVLPSGKTISTGVLRGERSEGMLCSIEELGLTQADFPYAVLNGIFILGEDCTLELGMPISQAIGVDDTVVDFEITPNRPDCLSVRGLAREAAATFNLPLKMPVPEYSPSSAEKIEDILSVELKAEDLCHRYCAAVVKNVKITHSPKFIRDRLRASGIRPINNIVDITNLVMLEMGQPMHAFDLSLVKGNKIVVRRAVNGERIVTLDDVERDLSDNMLVIADADSPSAVAGVMGGKNSGIEDGTSTVVFEAAVFLQDSVRRTAKALGLRTESSSRFEKGLDSEQCLTALTRALELVCSLGIGEVAEGIIDVYPKPKQTRYIELDADYVNSFLGVDISEKSQLEYLARLDIVNTENGLKIPSYRDDIEGIADIAEEIARLYGYNNIPTTPLVGVCEGRLTAEQRLRRELSNTMTAMGAFEVCTYSFISPKMYDKLCLEADSSLRDSVKILNPLGEDTSIMRTTAVGSMLEVVSRNYNNRLESGFFFEIATVYTPKGQDVLPHEQQILTSAVYGQGVDFYTVKGYAEALLRHLDVEITEVVPCIDNSIYHAGRCATIKNGDLTLAIVGEIAPAVAEGFDLPARVYAMEISVPAILELRATLKKYTPLPKFPAMNRDLAIICDEDIAVARLDKVIAENSGELLECAEIFDIYRGPQLPEVKKSVAYTLSLRSAERTLTVEECDAVIEKICTGLEGLGAKIRS